MTPRKLPGFTLDTSVQTLKLAVHQQSTKGKQMELLYVTLALSVVALVAQFGDFLSRRAAANAIGA